MAQNTKETKLKLIKISLSMSGVKKDYAFDQKTNIVYDYDSYLAVKDMGGEPLMVGKIMEKEGKKSFVKMSATSATASDSLAAVTPLAKPKKTEGGVAASSLSKEPSDDKKKVSGAGVSSAASTKTKDK